MSQEENNHDYSILSLIHQNQKEKIIEVKMHQFEWAMKWKESEIMGSLQVSTTMSSSFSVKRERCDNNGGQSAEVWLLSLSTVRVECKMD